MKRMATDGSNVESFYEESYFSGRHLEGGYGDFAATANRHYFDAFVGKDMTVIEFGSAGGWMLSKLDCAERIGIDINPIAREHAERNFGIRTYESFEPVAAETADLVISSHALEHTLRPADHVSEALRVLKHGGRAVFVVPCESILTSFREDDPDQHLYTWSPANLGNLFRACGFAVIEAKPFLYRFPPKPLRIQPLIGWRAFHVACKVWGHLYRKRTQVRLVAAKP